MLQNGYMVVPLSLIFLWLALIVIYRRIYNRNINRRLEGKKALRLIDPSRLNVISLVALLVIFNIITIAQAKKAEAYSHYQADRFLSQTFTGKNFEELGGKALGGLYEDPGAAGYLIETFEQNGFEYTVWTSPFYNDMMHADMIVLAEYTGERKGLISMYSTVRFKRPDGEAINVSCFGHNPDQCIMILLSCNQPCGIDISIDYIDDKKALDSIRQSGDFKVQIQNISKIHDSIELEWIR